MKYTVISEEKMVQIQKKGLVTGKTFNTIAEDVVGKWCIMIQVSNGAVGVGIDVNKNTALKLAIDEAVNA